MCVERRRRPRICRFSLSRRRVGRRDTLGARHRSSGDGHRALSIPEKTGISETMTCVSDLLT